MLWDKIFGGEGRAPTPPRKANAPAPEAATGSTLASAETLAALAAGVEEQLHAIEAILEASGADTASYAQSLEEGSIDLSDPDHARGALERLVGLTRDMVEKTRDVEARLRERNDAMALLNRGLEHIKRMPGEDHLGGPGNRREFERDLGSAAERARIYNTPLAIAFCDIDNFKAINDAHGHPAGDEVIRAIGEIFIRQTRQTDIVGRIGGDEFAVVLTHVNAEAAAAKAEALAATIATERVLHKGASIYISAAYGLTHLDAGDTAERALARADEAMYADKALHRRAQA